MLTVLAVRGTWKTNVRQAAAPNIGRIEYERTRRSRDTLRRIEPDQVRDTGPGVRQEHVTSRQAGRIK